MPRPDHDVFHICARLRAWRDATEECPMFPPDPPVTPEDATIYRVLEPRPDDVDCFIRLVCETRAAQRRYFRYRKAIDLARSKAMEDSVDRWLEHRGRQGRLEFGG